MGKSKQTDQLELGMTIKEIKFVDDAGGDTNEVGEGQWSSGDEEVCEYGSIEYSMPDPVLPVTSTFQETESDERDRESNAASDCSHKRRIVWEETFLTQGYNELPTLDEVVEKKDTLTQLRDEENQYRANKRRNLTMRVDQYVEYTSAEKLPRLDSLLSAFRLRSDLMTTLYQYLFKATIINLQSLLSDLKTLPLSTIVKELSITKKLLNSFLDSYPLDTITLVNGCNLLAAYKKRVKDEIATLDQSRLITSFSDEELASMPIVKLLIQASNAYKNLAELTLLLDNSNETTTAPESLTTNLDLINKLQISLPTGPTPFSSMINQEETVGSSSETFVEKYIQSIEEIQALGLHDVIPEIISMDSLFSLRWSLNNALASISSDKHSQLVNLINRLDDFINHDNALIVIAELSSILNPGVESTSTSSISMGPSRV